MFHLKHRPLLLTTPASPTAVQRSCTGQVHELIILRLYNLEQPCTSHVKKVFFNESIHECSYDYVKKNIHICSSSNKTFIVSVFVGILSILTQHSYIPHPFSLLPFYQQCTISFFHLNNSLLCITAILVSLILSLLNSLLSVVRNILSSFNT